MNVNNIYPLVIVADRYGGCYSGANYLAFNMYDAPDEVFGDDITCCEYFSNTKDIIGKGWSPQAAAEDLARKLRW
jgi:hypothetical protein